MSEVINKNEKALTVHPVDVFESLKSIRVGTLTKQERNALGLEIIDALTANAVIKIPLNAIKYASFCNATGASALYGPYAWEDKDGRLVIQIPYRVIVAWSLTKGDYISWFVTESPIENGLEEYDIVERCYILMKSDIPLISPEIQRDLVATSSVGVMLAKEMFYNTVEWRRPEGGGNKKPFPTPRETWSPMAPPTGWTWRQKCQKRALVNAISFKWGRPTISELAALGRREDLWMISEGEETVTSDWSDVREGASAKEAKAHAAANTRARKVAEEDIIEGETIEDVKILYGEEEKEHEPEDKAETVTKQADEDLKSEVANILIAAGDEGKITDGKERFKIQQLFTELGIGIPDWKEVTSDSISELIKGAMTENGQ